MSESSLQDLLARIDNDEEFRGRLLADAEAAVSGMDLSEVERFALASADEDALRRLVGSDTMAFGLGRPGGAASAVCRLTQSTVCCLLGSVGYGGTPHGSGLPIANIACTPGPAIG